jgi:hypothetical protein
MFAVCKHPDRIVYYFGNIMESGGHGENLKGLERRTL